MQYYLIYTLFLFAFFKGLFSIIGINEMIIQLIIDGIILLLSFMAFANVLEKKSMVIPYFKILILFVLIIILSYIINNLTYIDLLLFLRKFGIYLLFFYALYNFNLADDKYKNIVKLIIILFVIQIIAAFIKLFILGGTLEKIVGTASVGEGSLATILPLIAISFLIGHYIYFKKARMLIFLFLFLAIGLISNKMGILFYVGILFLILSYIKSKAYKSLIFINKEFLFSLIKSFVILLIIFVIFVKINPRANPEHKVGGSVNIEYLIKFVENYNTLEAKNTGLEGRGRFNAPFVALEKMYKKGITTVLLGFGPGDIIKSGFNKYKDPLASKHHIGYGGRTGFVWFLIQIGVLGVFLFVLIHVYIFRNVFILYVRYQNDSKINYVLLGMLGFIIVYFMDFFTYSSTLVKSPGVTITYYFLLFYITKVSQKLEKEANENIN